MDELFVFLKDYPKVAGVLISLVSGSLGWFFREIFQIIVENKKYKRELRTYFWKEKVNAAKKASEFYLEYKNFLNLMQLKFELFEVGKIEYDQFIDKIGIEVEQLNLKLKKFPHLEYHHINLFYEFNEEKSMLLSNEINSLIQNLISLNAEDAELDIKAKKIYKAIREKYAELEVIVNGYLDIVRNDIKGYI
ncbi:hypothetical protein [Marinifilum flexuosum]|uniref:hypothetical protein n=1 Tax=Marinifilum flexuosum TaxID=1117708 RepID=UPI0024959F8F|nr:hypothetical protein [Marinifilum flexuosum]